MPIDDEVVVKLYDTPESKIIKNRIEEHKRCIRNNLKDIAVNDEKIGELKLRIKEMDGYISDLNTILYKKTDEDIQLGNFEKFK